MKIGKVVGRHGDLSIRKIDQIPKDAIPMGKVLALGEATGHQHQLRNGLVYQLKESIKTQIAGYDVVIEKVFETGQKTELVHQEHNTAKLDKGMFAIVNEREYNPFKEKIQQVMD